MFLMLLVMVRGQVDFGLLQGFTLRVEEARRAPFVSTLSARPTANEAPAARFNANLVVDAVKRVRMVLGFSLHIGPPATVWGRALVRLGCWVRLAVE